MTDMTTDSAPEDVRKNVRERYGEIAAKFQPNQAASCCGPSSNSSCCSSSSSSAQSLPDNVVRLYEIPDAAGLPPEVTGLSLGCGDPVTLASLQPGQTVLDLGSGGGIDCFLAARQVGPAGRVIGVDMTPAMLEKARANREKLGAGNVEFRLGEIEHLPVADSTVDVIISNCVINLSPDKPQVFREAYRVLKPGGRLAVSDMVTSGELPEQIKANLSAWAGCIAGALDVQDYVRAVQSAGFTDVSVKPVYMDRQMIEEAKELLDKEIDLSQYSEEELAQAIFSAKITAVKSIQ
jgi:ubiquinone/menaquinone biosynthesis C-methylase UbiE